MIDVLIVNQSRASHVVFKKKPKNNQIFCFCFAPVSPHGFKAASHNGRTIKTSHVFGFSSFILALVQIIPSSVVAK